MDDETLSKLLAEVHRDYADYRCPEGVSVSPSSMSVMVDRTGKPVEEMIGIAEERESSSAQIKTLFNDRDERLSLSVARQFLITNSKQLEQNKNAKLYRKNYGVNNRIFVKFINKIFTEMEELRKFQSSTFDTHAKLIEDQNTIMELSGRLQELQNEVNCNERF